MISLTSEYALRAMVHLAEHPDSPCTILPMAQATQVPRGYLSKVMQNLVRHGLVASRRGLGGGFTLGRPCEEISIYDVLQAVDPVIRINTCPLNLPEHREKLCLLHQRLDDATAMMENVFRSTRLSDLLLDETKP